MDSGTHTAQINNKTVEIHLSYLGRCIEDRKDLGLGYCGSASLQLHSDSLTKTFWPRWIKIAKKAISDRENIESEPWAEIAKQALGTGGLGAVIGKPRHYYLFRDKSASFNSFVTSSNSYTHLLEHALSLCEECDFEIWLTGDTPTKVYPKDKS